MSFLHHDSNAFRISHKVQVDPSSEALVGWTVGAAWQSFCRFHSRNEPRGHLYHMQMWSESYRSTGNSLSPMISSGMRCHYEPMRADTELNEHDIVFCVVQDFRTSQKRHFPHKIWQIVVLPSGRTRYMIANAKGFCNGWVDRQDIFGKLVHHHW